MIVNGEFLLKFNWIFQEMSYILKVLGFKVKTYCKVLGFSDPVKHFQFIDPNIVIIYYKTWKCHIQLCIVNLLNKYKICAYSP